MDFEDLEIIVGTYEEFLLGYKVVQEEHEEYSLVQSFATHSHRASVRSVATGGKFLASGGTDESIFLYDMSTRKEAGLLMHHHGTVSCLEFAPNGSHLLSGGEDGSIGACRTGNWQLEKLWGKAHKGSAVTSVSIHPSGKLFLSVGVDGTVRTWNFVKGRPAYTTHLCKLKDGRSVTQVLWSPDGEKYSVLIGNRVEVFCVARASIVYTIQLDNKITCMSYINSDCLSVALEDGKVCLYNIEEKALIGQFQAHEGRVRCLVTFKPDLIVSASSSGQIKLWWIKDPRNVLELCEAATGCRITCMTLVNIKSNSLNVHTELLKLSKMSPMKVELDADFATESRQRSRPLGVVTVEVEVDTEPQSEVNTSAKIKKKKTSKRGATMRCDYLDPPLIKSVEAKHNKKKQMVVTRPLDGDGTVSDTSENHLKDTKLNKRIHKKKTLRVEEIQGEAPSKDKTSRRKVTMQVSEEHGEGKLSVNKDKSLKRGAVWDICSTKRDRGQRRSGETGLKKSKKRKTIDGTDVFDSPSGKWIAE